MWLSELNLLLLRVDQFVISFQIWRNPIVLIFSSRSVEFDYPIFIGVLPRDIRK